ncbi:hypothetical protein [Pseudomonas sp. UM16]|uniref:hypothetical protein n=1 Tax=Pseudomonas sp. UM16 TaxID=3158962 RepID=UPI0039901A7B
MFNFIKPPNLPPQLTWEYAHEPELMAWTIRARNYFTLPANLMFAFFSIVVLFPSYDFYTSYSPLNGIIFYIIMMAAVTSMTHQRVKVAYRFTVSGIEYCKWKEFPEWMLTFLKWFTGIAMVFCISIALNDPSMSIIALIGPGAMGLTYFSLANSKSFREMQTQYHHYFLKWEELTQATIASNREVVDVKYSIPKVDGVYIMDWHLNIFCKRHKKNQVADFIKPHLSPGVPCITAKLNSLLTTD